MKVVISIGGSLLTKGTDFSNTDTFSKNFNRYADVVMKLRRDGHQVVIVTGGGMPARLFQKIGRNFTKDYGKLDELGILATKLNAQLLSAALERMEEGVVYDRIIADPNDMGFAFFESEGKKIIVCGGWKPGCSTDLDAVLHAKEIGAELVINATNVDGVYTADPNKNPNAKKIDNLSYQEFRKIIEAVPQTPGEYRLFDLKGIDILQKNRIKLVVIDGSDPTEILRAVEGSHKGTVVG